MGMGGEQARQGKVTGLGPSWPVLLQWGLRLGSETPTLDRTGTADGLCLFSFRSSNTALIS